MNASTEAPRTRRGPAPLLWLFASLFLALHCGDSSDPTGGETHFLRWCDPNSQLCGQGLSCVCGVCSLSCSDSTACQGLSTAQCLPAADPGSCGDSQPVNRCDVPCVRDADCSALSGSHHCEQGSCRSGSHSTGGSAGAGAAGGAAAGDSGGSGGAGGADSCVHGAVEANQVLLLGDTFLAASHQITAYLEGLARDAGALPNGQRYRDNSTTVGGNALALTGNGIATQYEQGKAEGSVQVVIMNGGGADMLGGRCDAPISECRVILDAASAAQQLFAQMATDGVSHVIYAFYPDPVDLALREKMDVLRPLIQAACEGSPVPCHWLDLRPVFADHYSEYVIANGRDPSDAGSLASAQAIWALMQRECIAQ